MIVVTGPPGSGKTTLAHALARGVGCPAICRDEIKEGMVFGVADFTPAPLDPLTQRTFRVFFDVLKLLLDAGVTLVAEAAFRARVWDPNLQPLLPLADVRVLECHADPVVAHARSSAREAQDATRRAHVPPPPTPFLEPFEWISLEVPKLEVETTDGYAPELANILAFIRR